MRSGQIWITVTTTDRPGAFARLLGDIADLALDKGGDVRVLAVENSKQSESRTRNQAALVDLRARGVLVEYDEFADGGGSIAASRLRQRELVRRTMQEHGCPGIVWMLDDDVRLGHVVWTGRSLHLARLHDPLSFLRTFAGQNSHIDMLIGEVTGDPPIPALATLATRFADLRWNLARFFSMDPASDWRVPSETIALLREPDAYYDLSVERAVPAWRVPCAWLPRRGGVSAEEACLEMLEDASRLPFGVAFTRPILADEDRLARVQPTTRRGGNAVFFDAEACLSHDYPVVVAAGVETRRSDMVGASLLASRRPGRVVSSGFSVAHARPSSGIWPSAGELHRALLADTLGAHLARAVASRLSRSAPVADFRIDRMRRIREAATSLRESLRGVSDLLGRAPGWIPVRCLEGVTASVEWALSLSAAALTGVLDAFERDLLSRETHVQILERAEQLVQGASE